MVQARDSHGRFKADHSARNTAIGVAAGFGALAAGVAAAFRFGLLDRLLPAGGEHAAPDLALDAAPAGTNRAPDAFRPDPTAPVPASEREGLRPATTVATGFTEDRTTEALLN
ncbi:hypothetical protein [Sphingomonas immobilis]|uniref:Uncharacterized protein n=1 Tax=Sphingomonas immobilis TaxID=3063997 RepID=A0ABT9A6W5_9SPHN|nr:hypothetical protein [Sphingomonas sp. CA1-15]MDO7844507.1 hypothetical protein [Sphingomonas sp. CA1-15]